MCRVADALQVEAWSDATGVGHMLAAFSSPIWTLPTWSALGFLPPNALSGVGQAEESLSEVACANFRRAEYACLIAIAQLR
jgi:hypothetical protein